MTKQRHKKKNRRTNLKIEWDTNCGRCKLVQLLLFVTTGMMLGRHFFWRKTVICHLQVISRTTTRNWYLKKKEVSSRDTAP